jgi:hypothetical protein
VEKLVMGIIDTVVGKGCTHNTYDNGIHEFVFSATTREAVDTWIDFNLKLYAEIDTTHKLRILFDTSHAGILPLGYVIKRIQDLIANRPDGLLTQNALIIPPNPVNNLARSLTNNLLRVQQLRDQVKFFSTDQRNPAIDWLLRE